MNTIPSSELVRRALQDVADWANSRGAEAVVRVEKDAVLGGENIREVVVVEHGVNVFDSVNS